MARVLMPKATALWLMQNTQLTTQQISDFCKIHRLELGTLSKKASLHPVNPLDMQQLTSEEIRRCEDDPQRKLRLCTDLDKEMIAQKSTKKTEKSLDPIKEKGVAWMIVHYPAMPDEDMASLLKVGKRDIKRVRTIITSKAIQIESENPVTLGLCKKSSMNRRIRKGQKEFAPSSSSI